MKLKTIIIFWSTISIVIVCFLFWAYQESKKIQDNLYRTAFDKMYHINPPDYYGAIAIFERIRIQDHWNKAYYYSHLGTCYYSLYTQSHAKHDSSGFRQKAYKYFEKALTISISDITLNNMGRILNEYKDSPDSLARAIKHFKEAYNINPKQAFLDNIEAAEFNLCVAINKEHNQCIDERWNKKFPRHRKEKK